MNVSLSSYYLNTRPEIGRLLPTDYSKVLEIGCGGGNFATMLKQRCDYWGIEPVQVAAEKATRILNKVLIGTYQEVYDQLPDGYFDLVICNDVIEHMTDHNAFFQAIKKKMTPCSYMIGSIPNVRYIGNLYKLLIKKDWQYDDGGGILDSTHVRFFTEKSLKRTFTQNHFLIEAFTGINRIIMTPKSIKGLLFAVSVGLIVFASIGFYQDVQFRQFGFRIKHQGIGKPS